MASRNKSIPYIYGYTKLFKDIETQLKDTTRLTKEDVLERSLLFLDNYNESNLSHVNLAKREKIGKFQTKNEKQKAIISALFLIYLGWSGLVYSRLYGQIISGLTAFYLLGLKDARVKLVKALEAYDGELKNEVPAIISAIKQEELNLPISVRVGLDSQAVEEINNYDRALSKNLALGISIIFLLNIPRVLKEAKIRSAIDRYYRILKPTNTQTKSLVKMVHFGGTHYYMNKRVPYHRWVINQPDDTPCIISAGEIVKVGEPFSNGFYWGGDVHRFCECTTVPEDLTDNYIRYLIRRYR